MSSACVVEASWPLYLRVSEGNVSFLNFAIGAVREASLPPGCEALPICVLMTVSPPIIVLSSGNQKIVLPSVCPAGG